MVGEKPEIICLLKHMKITQEPVGSGKACDVLASGGFQVSEATVGRLLRQLDLKGYTQRLGFRGRVLTPEGLDFTEGILYKESRRKYSDQLAGLVRSRSKEDLLETLVARRAIEREIARLAALKITAEQIARLSFIVGEYEQPSDDEVSSGDVAFHQFLAETAGNRVLRAALDLIRQDAQLSPVLGYIRDQVHSSVFVDHKKIFEAIAARNPEEADRAMVQHIENLIRDVNKYWSQVNG